MAYTQDENSQFNTIVEYNLAGSGDLEGLLDAIADALIKSPLINTGDVQLNQKFIRNGQIQIGEEGGGTLALYQKDVEANVEDNLQSVADQINSGFEINIQQGIDDSVSITIEGGGFSDGGRNITEYVLGENNPLNIGQFIPIKTTKSNVDINKAEEFLDTNIFELIPEGDTRQSRIVRFFQELNALLPPTTPEFDVDGTPGVDREEGTNNWVGSLQYSQDNSISYAQDNQDGNIDEEDAFFHRLKNTANSTNSTKTIEDIYNTIEPFLKDILEDQTIPQDDRPEYENQSTGYLQFRNLNQGIIVRNTNQEFIEGLDPNNLAIIDRIEPGASDNDVTPGTGFTITMWVKFLDKVSTGTLFNFGNPTRQENPFGFKLETFVINKDDKIFVDENQDGNVDVDTEIQTFEEYLSTRPNHQGLKGDKQLFQSTDTERFVRLQVREFGDFASGTDLGLRDSALGYSGIPKFSYNPPNLDKTDNGEFRGSDERRLLNYTHIPENFDEWYFICATYNPRVNEEESVTTFFQDYKSIPEFWLNHFNPINGEFVANSGFGNKCKVEIISRTDLLRARGFKV
tara:strand:- start:5674 stop:7389 length:1716 start_codon:yes stop_codon:yes gene_type:complete